MSVLLSRGPLRSCQASPAAAARTSKSQSGRGQPARSRPCRRCMAALVAAAALSGTWDRVAFREQRVQAASRMTSRQQCAVRASCRLAPGLTTGPHSPCVSNANRHGGLSTLADFNKLKHKYQHKY